MARPVHAVIPHAGTNIASRRSTAERNILGGYLVSLLMLAIISVASYQSIIRLDAAAIRVEHTHRNIEKIQTLMRSMQTLESAMRGFLLTGDGAFLGAYQHLDASIEVEMESLGQLLADDADQQRRWNTLRPLISQKLAYIISGITPRQTEDRVSTIMQTRILQGEHLMERISAIAGDMEADERSLLATQDRERESGARRTLTVIEVGNVLAIVLLSLALLVINRDLAARRRAVAQLARISTLQRAILDSADFTIISTDIDGVILTFSAGARRMLSYSATEVVGKMTPAFIHVGSEIAEHAAVLSTELGRRIEPGFEVLVAKACQGESDENVWTYVRKDGSRFPVLLSITALRDERENLAGYLCIGKDITQQQTAEQSLRDSEARLRAVLDSTVDGIITIDSRGAIESFNSAAERLFGYVEAEVLGLNFKILMPEPYHSAHDTYLANFMGTGEASIIGAGRAIEGLHKNGKRFPIYLAMAEVVLGGKRIFTGIVRDITESRKIERMKNEFISTVSHELRTPLTSIRGSLGLIAGGAVGEIPDKVKTLIEIACNNSDRLVRLINDILDIEKIASGNVMFNMAPQPLMPIVEQALVSNQPYATQLGVRFALTQGLPEANVAVDSDRLLQVLTNLLSNAAKFSPKGSAIEVSVIRRDGAVRVAVTDHGPGIPVEFQDHIFDKFAQADGSDQRQKGGTGLGLSITKDIVEKHGGIIDYDTSLDHGSTFYFELPLLIAHAPRDPVDADQARILVCEDDADIAQSIAMMLGQQGYATDIAYSAEQAKLRMSEHTYAAMTLDLMLPGQDGISLVHDLRATEAYCDLPIIIVSAKSQVGRQGLNGGAIRIVDWLDKPIDQGCLLRAAHLAVRVEGGMPRILHVEDDADVIRVVATILAGQATLIPAASLSEAQALLTAEHFDLVLLDINLPDGSGLDLLPLINQLPLAPPVTIISASDVHAGILNKVASALVKSQTSNTLLAETIARLIDVSMAERGGRTYTSSKSIPL